MGFLTYAFALLIGLGFFFIFPVRNTVKYRNEPWATWGLIAVTLLFWAAVSLAGRFDAKYGLAEWFDQLVFAEDFSRPWTLVTAQFVHPNTFQMLLSLWYLYLIAPILEERITPVGLLLLFIFGGAAVAALYGVLCQALGARIALAGMAPGFYVLLGLYLVLCPFDEIVFFYNILFFTFCGTVEVATFFLVVFALLFHGLSGLLGGVVTAGAIAWLEEAVPILGLGVGFAFGWIVFGLGAFVGRPPAAEVKSQERFLERALERMLARSDRTAERSAMGGRRAKGAIALAEKAPPEQVETFAEKCLCDDHEELLEAAYAQFRARFPDRCFAPGLQAQAARRFEDVGRHDLAIDAYRLLLEFHSDVPVAADARLRLARLLAADDASAEEAIELLEEFLRGRPRPEVTAEVRQLLQALIEKTGREDTYEGLGPHKPFRFSPTASAPGPLEKPMIGRSAREIVAPDEPSAPPAPDKPPKPIEPQEIVPDPDDQTLTAWGLRPSDPDEVAAATAQASSFAIILAPGHSLEADDVVPLVAAFWSIRPDEATEQLRACRGVLANDVPAGRATVLARKLTRLGLPVVVVPVVADLAYATCEDVVEFAWTDSECSNVTRIARRAFAWDQVRLASIARVGLPGAGQAYRLVLDLYVAEPNALLRFWENTVNFTRSRLGGRADAPQSLQALVDYLDPLTPRALKTSSFAAAAKKVAPPLDFHSLDELDHYNRWFLYAGFGKYAAEQ